MILGHIHIDEDRRVVTTHRDSYILDGISVASVRRPFLPASLLCGGGLAGFALAFGDLLYPGEIALTLTLAATAIGLGWEVGQLKLLSRDLRGSELADLTWGRYASLNRIRLKIAAAVVRSRSGGAA